MRLAKVMLCCWPGLLRLWLQGDWWSLAVAAAYAGALNLLIAVTLPGTMQLPSGAQVWASLALFGWWLFSALQARRALPALLNQLSSVSGNVNERGADDRGLFIQAQGEYLRGNWLEAESLLKRTLRHSRHDVDARLLLATLYRRTRRYDEAHLQLADLAQSDRADKWRWEMNAERRELLRLVES